MPTSEVTTDRLRELAELRPERGRVLSLFLNLEPTEFATAQARSSAISSLLDEADRTLRGLDGLDHDDLVALREDVDRVRRFFDNDFSAKGAHGLALFVCGRADLWEVLKLPRPVETAVVVNERPYVEPLAIDAGHGEWCVLLVNRRDARILRGAAERLEPVERVTDDIGRRHDQGGWSQARYQRSRDQEAMDHVRRALDELFRIHKLEPVQALLIGAPEGIYRDVVEELHPYLREKLVGRVEIDVEHSSDEDVRKAVQPIIEEEERRRERTALDRLQAGLGQGQRAVSGLDDVLDALNEQRVEILLFERGFTTPGVACPQCGWMGAQGRECPVDGTRLEQHDDVLECAVRSALAQSAEIRGVRHHDDLSAIGSMAAVLRF